MGTTTSTFGLYKPGGGSTGVNGADENADIDKINQNFDLLDGMGLPARATTYATLPNGKFVNQRGYVINDPVEYRWSGSTWIAVGNGTTSAQAYATGSQTFNNGSTTPIGVGNVTADPSGKMAPTSGSGFTQWPMPWVGKYRMTVSGAFGVAIPSGNYFELITGIISGPFNAGTSDRQGHPANEPWSFSVTYYNNTAGRLIVPYLTQQGGSAVSTTNAGTYGTEDQKTLRVLHEYLGS